MKKTRLDVLTLLGHIKKECSEMSDCNIQESDGRLGKLIALTKPCENGCIEVKSDYLSYNEMYYFLMGYLMKTRKYY